MVFDMSDEWELAMTIAERNSLAQQVIFMATYRIVPSAHPSIAPPCP